MTLGSTTESLSSSYDLAMLDLDGVVYLGDQVIPGARDELASAGESGLRLAYITNNASRTARQVARKLRGLGIPGVAEGDVVTSAQAVARLMAEALPAGSAVLVVGGEGLRDPLERHGLKCVQSLDQRPVAVVQGFHPDVGWKQLSEAAFAIQSGLPWYVSNMDMTVPTPRGIAPGNGSLVHAVRNATGGNPVVAGKPERALFDETMARVGGRRPLMVGDRLDTDIDGAVNAGIDSLAVLTGVSTLRDIAEAPPGHRPTYISMDLRGLNHVHHEVVLDGDIARCGSSEVRSESGLICLTRGEPAATETLRAVLSLAWSHKDQSDLTVQLDGTLVP